MSVAEIASKFKVSAIVVYTESGSTAKADPGNCIMNQVH